MTTTVLAHFDGKQSLVLDEPVELPVGTPLRLHVETVNDKVIPPAVTKVTPAPLSAARYSDRPGTFARDCARPGIQY